MLFTNSLELLESVALKITQRQQFIRYITTTISCRLTCNSKEHDILEHKNRNKTALCEKYKYTEPKKLTKVINFRSQNNQ